MNTPRARLIGPILLWVALAIVAVPAAVHAQQKKKNPASKIYVSDVAGEAQIDTGTKIEDVNRRSVYSAEGVVIDTEHPADAQDKHFSTLVFSNGTGAYLAADTRVEIKQFVQEPFLPTRADMETEPSISQMQVFIARGTVGLCPSKLVAGSKMAYSTPYGSVNLTSGQAVIQSEEGVTKISMLDGDSTVRAGTMDMGGHTIHAGEQAIIRPSASGQPNSIQIVKLSSTESEALGNEVGMACMAKRTVYFEVRGRQANNESEVTAFNGESTTTRQAGDPITTSEGEIVAVPVVPSQLPVQFTVSPAAIITPSGQVITPGRGTPTPGQGGPPGG